MGRGTYDDVTLPLVKAMERHSLADNLDDVTTTYPLKD